MMDKSSIAVSIEFEVGSDQAPQIGVRGERAIAREMKRLAVRFGIAITDNPTLAEQLGKCSAREQIPEELYEELAYVIHDPIRGVY